MQCDHSLTAFLQTTVQPMKTPVTCFHTSPVLRAVEISIHTDEIIPRLSGNLETTCVCATSLSKPAVRVLREVPMQGCTLRSTRDVANTVPFHFTRPFDTKVLSFSVS